MSPDGPSNIRVFIRWHDATVFAGEEIKCRITFQNVAPSQPSVSSAGNHSSQSSPQPVRDSNSAASPLHHPNRSKATGLVPPPTPRRHRSSLSLSVPSVTSSRSHHRAGSIPWSPQTGPESQPTHSNGHRRSISIVSIGSAGTGDSQRPGSASSAKAQRASRGHARASSLQILSRGSPMHGPRSGNSPPVLFLWQIVT